MTTHSTPWKFLLLVAPHASFLMETALLHLLGCNFEGFLQLHFVWDIPRGDNVADFEAELVAEYFLLDYTTERSDPGVVAGNY